MIPDPLRGLLRYPGNFVLAKEYIDAGCKIQAHHLLETMESHPIEAVVWLLQHGADANAKLGYSSVLTVAMERYCTARDTCDFTKIILTFKMKESIEKLLEYGAIPIYEEIRMSILTRDRNIVRWCLEANTDFEIDLGLLCLAIENSDTTGDEVLETLLKDVKVRSILDRMIDGIGQPLVFALFKAPRIGPTMRILLENGASPNSLSDTGHSVLELAYQMDLMDAVLLLLSAGSTLDSDGRRRLLLAHGKENLDLIDCQKAFLMIRQGSTCPQSVFGQLPADILDEILIRIIQMGVRAYCKHL